MKIHSTFEINLPRHAGILCNDPRFQKFAATRCGLPGEQFHSTAAAEYLRTCCGVSSRSELEIDHPASSRFNILLTEFDAWVGRIGQPR